jgi:hypothetical protein
MNSKLAKDDPRRRTVSVQATLHGQTTGQTLPSTRAYLFDRAGRLVDSKPVTDGATQFDVAANQDYRVTVGPDLLASSKEAPANLAAQLAKANSVSQDILQVAPQDSISVRINPNIWFCWFPTCINVHGTVQKAAGTGGTNPICTGTVQIFQVDLGCTLDSFTFFNLAAFKSKLIQKLSGEAQVVQRALGRSTASAMTLQQRASLQDKVQAVSVSSSASSVHAAAQTVSLADAVTTIATLEGPALKQYLIANRALLSLFWCEFIPDYAFCWQELGEVPIQSDGTFSAEVCFWCPQDFPDLYFEVIQNIDGTDIEISDPQIACSTYYNYDGSESVDITVYDPRAVACLPTGTGPGYLFVWPTAIGNQDLGAIDGLETLVGTGLLPGNTPWGGTLPLQMIFHPDLQSNNVVYYRWSYRFDGDSDFTPINAPVSHRYMTIAPGPVIHLNSVNLGPKTVGATSNLFEIPDPLLPWVNINDPADRPFAYFDSTGGVTPRRSGMCTLLLELFDGAGNFVPCNNPLGPSTWDDQGGDAPPPGNFTFLLPQIGGPPDTYANAPTPNITDHGRLIFRILVDNNSTVAELPRVATALGSTDTDPCGVLHYSAGSDNVELDYVAWHPNNFLDWDLYIYRGIMGVAADIPWGAPGTNTSAGSPGFPVAFNNSAATLLGPCIQAGFAVNLYCAARATDGYSRQSEYDSSATIGFALLHP